MLSRVTIMRVFVISCSVWAAVFRSTELAIRLVGPSPCEGRVEVYHNQYWGTICATFWDLNISSVVCRELNCGTAVEASDNGKYQHYGHSWNYSGLSFFQCRGNESELLSCTYEVFPHHHKPVNDGGVKCTGVIQGNRTEWTLRMYLTTSEALENMNYTELQNSVLLGISSLTRLNVLEMTFLRIWRISG
ncbi:CD5 antigen-like isoform X1 [Xenopus laevis]|uniref:CD5 antigen-like isoform X1 n=1 Tax=Xenopus laevis TaxID=8355 RepID=A0A8J1L9U8_XENLA|nr:CD5 antigen-like isoform X1 [Xenopus laevis]